LIRIGSDPPIDLAKGQSLWTDPSQYVFFARNFITFGTMDLFSPSNLTFFKYSIISFISIPVFWVIGSGFWQANIISSLISFLGISIFAIIVKRSFGLLTAVLAAIFVGYSYIIVMHNRIPYLENPSITLIILSSYLLFYIKRRKISLISSGFTFSCSILMGKTLAIMVFPAFVLSLWAIRSAQREKFDLVLKDLLCFVLGMSSFAILALLLFYLPNYLSTKEYLYENVISYYGFPEGLKSVSGFFKSIYTFDLVNFDNRYFSRMPIISLCCISFFAYSNLKNDILKQPILVFFGVWFLFGLLFLSPWNYRPIRYELYLYMPMAALAAVFLNRLIIGDLAPSKYSYIISVFVFSFVSFHIYYNIAGLYSNPNYLFGKTLIISFVISAIISIIIHLVILLINRKYYMRSIIVFALLAYSIFQDSIYYKNWFSKITYAIEYVNKILPRQVGHEAIVIGPYAQTITLGNLIKSEIFYFGAYEKNESLFRMVPATHTAYEIGMGSPSGNEIKFAEYYPEIYKRAIFIDSYLIGRYYIRIQYLGQDTGADKHAKYDLSNFEKAMQYYNNGDVDSAFQYFNEAEKDDRLSRASLYMGNIYFNNQQFKNARDEYRKGLAEDCYDPKFWILYSIACQKTGQIVESIRARNLALRYEPYPGFNNLIKF
jgi:4-amino-4-deoxy-L-arabinose transferase-like glycosyltransferase